MPAVRLHANSMRAENRNLDKTKNVKVRKEITTMMGFELIIIAGVLAYVLGWRPQFNLSRPAQISQTPLDILKARYAQGEITLEEYEQMQRDLEG